LADPLERFHTEWPEREDAVRAVRQEPNQTEIEDKAREKALQVEADIGGTGIRQYKGASGNAAVPVERAGKG